MYKIGQKVLLEETNKIGTIKNITNNMGYSDRIYMVNGEWREEWEIKPINKSIRDVKKYEFIFNKNGGTNLVIDVGDSGIVVFGYNEHGGNYITFEQAEKEGWSVKEKEWNTWKAEIKCPHCLKIIK